MPFLLNQYFGIYTMANTNTSEACRTASNQCQMRSLGLNNSLKIIYILILYSNRRPLPPVPFPSDELLREGVEQGNRALIELSD
jgi:hypothetical protein